MTSIVTSTFNPRSFIYSSNSETLILQSATPEARLSFINSSYSNGDFRYLMSATAQTLTIGSILNLATRPIQTFSTVSGIPNVETHGSIVGSNVRFSSSTPNTSKLIIFRDDNPSSSTQFTGIGYNTANSAIEYRAPGSPYDINSHIFYSGTGQATSTPLMVVRPNPTSGIAQVGIGIAPGALGSTISLALANDLQIAGNLIVQNITINPNTIVTVDPISNRISSNIMPPGVVFTSGTSNLIDTSLLPVNFSGTYFKTYKNFGIGTRNPVQRLHVQGNTYITDRLGVGVAYPANRLHVVEYAAAIPTATLYNTSGGDVLQTFITSNTINGPVNLPILTVVGTHQGVGIGTQNVSLTNTLQVRGNTDTTSLTTQNIAISKTLTGNLSTINLIGAKQNIPLLNYTSNLNILNIGISTNFNSNCTIFGNTTVYNPINTLSDLRIKHSINPLINSLAKINSINGYTYGMLAEQNTINNPNRYIGVVAQEVYKVVPEAVHIDNTGLLSVKYDSLIPLLIESIKELTAKVQFLEQKISTNMDTS